MQDRDCLVFVEVRYRKASAFASAAASIDKRKQRKLALTAAFFLSRRRRYADVPVRFDVVAIDVATHAAAATAPRLEWIRDAFRPDY